MPSVLNQILNQPSSRSGSPDVLAMAAAAAAVAQAKTELKKDVCFYLFFIFSYVCRTEHQLTSLVLNVCFDFFSRHKNQI